MRDWLVLATNLAVDAIDWLALVLIVVGAVEAFFQGLWTMFASQDGHHERNVWLRLGRWLPRTPSGRGTGSPIRPTARPGRAS